MKVETIDRLMAEDMIRQGKNLNEILNQVPKNRRGRFSKNIRGLIIEICRKSGKPGAVERFLFGECKEAENEAD